MSITLVKPAVASILRSVPGMGEVTSEPLDPRQDAQRIRTTSRNPYWCLRVTGMRDEPATFGSSTRALFRTYALRLDGYRGIVGATVTGTDAWEELVEAILDALETGQGTVAAQTDRSSGVQQGGLVTVRELAAEGIGVERIGDDKGEFRAHRATITGAVQYYVVRS